jgi:RNA polymerase sigma factor (sigma-70 family)
MPTPNRGDAPEADCDAATRLVDALAARDLQRVVPAAWAAHFGELYVFFRRHGELHDTARDLVQATFVLLVEHWSRFDGGHFRGWLYTLARYTLLSHVAVARRERRRQRLCALARPPDPPLVPDVRLDHDETLQMAFAFIARLDPVERAIAEATFFDGCDARDVAVRLEALFGQPFSVEAVRTRRHRIRVRLAAWIARRERPAHKGGTR